MKLKKIITLLVMFAAFTAFFTSCEDEVPPEDDPNITVAPERPSVVPGNKKLNARWTVVAGADSYNVFVAAGSADAERFDAASRGDFVVLDGTKLAQITLTGLENGAEYFIWTQAAYPHGLSPLSEPGSGKPTEPPVTPSGFALTPDDEMLKASWSRPYSEFGGTVGSYELAVSTENLDADPEAQAALAIAGEDERNERYSAIILKKAMRLVEAGADSTSALVDRLENGKTYYLYLRAKNTAGGSNFTARLSASPFCAGPPSAPATLTVVGGNKKLSLSWPAAVNASSYAVYKNSVNNASGATLVQEGIRPKIGDTTAVVPGLANGTACYVWVVARNSQNRANNAASAQAAAGSGTPVAKPRPDYGSNGTEVGSMSARFVDAEFGKGDRLARKQETPLTDLTADAAVWWAREHAGEYGVAGGIDFAFFNGGYIGGGHDAGPVTVGSLKSVYTGTHGGGSAWSIITLTGDKVKQLFEFAATILHNGGGGHPTGAFGQVSAEVTYTINYTYGDPLYGILENLKIHGAAVEPAREYRLITPTWLCDGGDGYGAYLYSSRRKDTGVSAWRMAAEYIYDQDFPLDPVTDGRITLVGAVWSGAAH